MKHIFSVVAFFLLTVVCHGQQLLVGKVVGPDDKPLPSAHVLDIRSRMATTTDSYGKFNLSLPDSGSTLRVSHIGFRPTLVNVPTPTESNVTIRLDQISTLLSAVVVSGKDEPRIFGKRGLVMHDFSFAKDRNLLLMAEDGIRYLVLCNDRWKEISRLEVGKKGDRLYDDCLGNTHLFGEDSVYQISIDSGRPTLFAASSQAYFLEQMAHCTTSSDSHIFFSSYDKAGKEVYHYGFHKKTKEGVILQRVFDHIGLQDIQDYFANLPHRRNMNRRFRHASTSFEQERLLTLNEKFMENFSNADVWYAASNDPDIIPLMRYQQFVSRPAADIGINAVGMGENQTLRSTGQYFRSVSNVRLEQQSMFDQWRPSPSDRGWLGLLSEPTYSPIFNLRDSIYVFDHVLGICHVHDGEGNSVRSFPIEHHEHKGWRNLLVADRNGQKLYAHSRLGNTDHLMEIDLDNGAILRTTELRGSRFSEQVKVKDGYAYYLREYRDIHSPDQMLRQKL